LQPLVTGPEIWRRASPSPAPRPVLASAEAIILPPPRARHGSALQRARSAIPLLAALLVILATGARQWSAAAPLAASVDRLLELGGFGVRQVWLSGYRVTPDGDIFDALQLEHARTLLFFDSGAAQRRIEALPSVANASVARVLPDRVEVRITERTPIAVWQRGDGSFLIDSSGRVLSPVTPDPQLQLQLPCVAGEGANAVAADLLQLLGAYPVLLHALTRAERVGARRWTLLFADGGTILLPAEDAGAALARAVAVASRLRERASAIDVRTHRTLIGAAPRAGAGDRSAERARRGERPAPGSGPSARANARDAT